MRLLSRLRRPRASPAAAFDAAAALAEHAARLAASLARVDEREARVAQRERFVRRWLERGAAELDERADALRALAVQLEERERRVAGLERDREAAERTLAAVAAREEELARRESRLALEELQLRTRAEEAGPAREWEEGRYVVFAWSAEGYRLEERDGDAPEPGAPLAGQVVVRLGRSPLPGDRRRCAFCEPAP